MRTLNINELAFVSGAGKSSCVPTPPPCEPTPPACGRAKGNNGFGNGGDDGVPGHSNFQDATR